MGEGMLKTFLTIITGAALVGLFILNPGGSGQVLDALGGNTVSYVKAVQGR